MANTLAGGEPEEIATMEISPIEFCRTIYLPIQMKGEIKLPKRFYPYLKLIESIENKYEYMYLTVNHGICPINTYSNRPGWHVDGYMSEDENYIWCSSQPTEYMECDLLDGPDDHEEALNIFKLIKCNVKQIKTNTLYKLGKSIHRSPIIKKDCVRTFVKISCSNEQYNLKGNAVNELFDYTWKYVDRVLNRNHPVGE